MRQWRGGTVTRSNYTSLVEDRGLQLRVQCAVVPWGRPRLAKRGGIRSIIVVMEQECWQSRQGPGECAWHCRPCGASRAPAGGLAVAGASGEARAAAAVAGGC